MGKTHIKVAAMLLTALSLGSCGIYTKYQRPGIPVADSLYREIPTTADTSSIASLSWRELFSDSLLVGWIELALEKNTDLRIAELKVEEASANLLASRLAYLPSVGISAQFEAGNAGAAENNWSAGLSTEWELDIFGRLTNAKRQSYAALGQSEEYREAVRSRLIATVAENYYMLLTLDEKKAVTERTEENWEKTVRTLEALMDAGQTNRAAVSQARAELLAARQSVLELEKEIFTLENSFSSLLGIAPGRIERSAGLELKLPEGLSTGLSVELLRNRPDVREAEQNLVKAFYATTGARSDFYPKITLGGSAGWTDNLGCAISNPGGWILKAVGSLVQPLFNRGKNISALRGAEARQEEALLSWQQKILDAGNEVNDAMKQCHTAALHLELSRSKTAELENAVLSTELLMENGNVNYLEVLTARQALLASQIDEVEDIYDGIQGTIRLYHALGGGSR